MIYVTILMRPLWTKLLLNDLFFINMQVRSHTVDCLLSEKKDTSTMICALDNRTQHRLLGQIGSVEINYTIGSDNPRHMEMFE